MEKLAYSINETARALSLGRTSIYAMIADKRLDAFKLGRRTLIRADSVRRLVAGEGYPTPGRKQIAVKVIDIFGNDTTKIIGVEV